MRNTSFLKYRRLLAQAETEAKDRLAHGRPGIAITTHGDDIDRLTELMEREHSITATTRSFDALRQIRAALARIDAGTYGVCLECEEPVPEKRLNALPWAPHCIECQELLDELLRLDQRPAA
ncbi:MAG: TraR/DksA C4-type zinc finger protein [Bryobacterales bacterium]|nr:TraR/DksA C4-type zinc finger protein [Bryobacterales bacterium]